MPKALALLSVWLVLVAGVWTGAVAQAVSTSSEPDVPEKTGKDLKAFRLRGPAPRIDGRLDEEVWKQTAAIDDFVQMEPQNMGAPSERTVVRVAFDDRYIYLGIRCYTRSANSIRSGLGRRDSIPESDRIHVHFDPRHDHQTAYVYQVNASGVQGDFTVFNDTQFSFDYDGVWDAAVEADAAGWVAEMRIPFSQMRFDIPPGENATWGFNIERHMATTGEDVRWVPTPRGVNGLVSRFGHLVFGERLTPPRRVEFLPFTLAKSERSNEHPGRSGASAGFDVRVGLGASTLSATINPDFGQVEVDPAVLNLTVFETFFPEKRPFFLEDSRIFVLPYEQVSDFYSRRIGQVPGHFVLKDEEELVEKPADTTIIGAAKLTGKSSGWTYGALGAVTEREYAGVDVKTIDVQGIEQISRNTNRLVEPAALYSVGRIQRDIGGSNLGAIATGVIREKDLDAFTGGPDFNIRWNQNQYLLTGHWLVTRAPVEDAMRTDFGGVTNFDVKTKHLGVFVHADHFGKNFRNTDLGFLATRANKNELSGTVSVIQPDPWKMFRSMNVQAGVLRRWTDERLVFTSVAYGGFNADFRNFWSITGGGDHSFSRLDDADTRGGPPIFRAPGESLYFGLWTDSRKKWRGNIFVNGSRDREGAWDRSIETGFRFQVADRLQASGSVNYQRGRDVAQWIKNEDLDADGIEENIYGRLARNVVNITGRTTYSFSRDMTLEAYLQPFVAAGDYSDVRRLALPRSFQFDSIVPVENPDFNDKSLRGTIVMRWEYKRGSTLFLVWNMATMDASRPGEFSVLRDLGSAFHAAGSHAFVAKLSYWIAP